jgi:membrane protease YdiL (CAAX protease family)
MTDARPRAGDRLVWLAILAFSADILIFRFTIRPLRDWADAAFGSASWGIVAHYGLRGASALLFGFAMVHFRAALPRDLGLAVQPFREDAAWFARVAGGLLVAAVLYIAVGIAASRFFGLDLRQWQFFETADHGWTGYLLYSVIAAPIVEEAVYRGLLTPALRAGYGDRGAILAGALLFYILHLVYGQPYWMVHYFIAGAILTWAFLERGRLWICIVLHAGGNLLVVADDALRDFAPELFKKLVG